MKTYLILILLFISSLAFPADVKISELVALPYTSWAAGDLFAIVDVSATATRKTSIADFDGRYVLKSEYSTLFDAAFVTKDSDDLDEGSTNLYFTDARAQAAVVVQTITNNITATSPSQDAVYDALDGKMSSDFNSYTSYTGFATDDLLAIWDTSLGGIRSAPVSFFDSRYVVTGTSASMADGSNGSPAYRMIDNDSGMYSSGDGNVSFSANGVHHLSIDQTDSTFTGDLHITGNVDAANYPPTGSNNTLAYYDGAGSLASSTTKTFNAAGGIDTSLTTAPNNTGGLNFEGVAVNIEPTLDSPNSGYNYFNFTAYLDPTLTGFAIGTGGNAWTWQNLGIDARGSGNVGQLNYHRMQTLIGNGTDSIVWSGGSYIESLLSIASGVTVSNQIKNIGMNWNAAAGSTLNGEILGIYDSNNFSEPVQGYREISFAANLGGIKNNSNYTMMSDTNNIGDLLGNAGAFGITMRPVINSIDTGQILSFDARPVLTTGTKDNVTLMSVDVSQISGTNNKSAQFIGKVEIQGDLDVSGSFQLNNLSIYKAQNIIDGGGNPTSVNQAISQVTAPNGTTINNAGTLGLNTAMILNVEANATVNDSFIGLAALGLPMVIESHTGSNVNAPVTGALFAISLSGASTGGDFNDTVSAGTFVLLPNAGGSIFHDMAGVVVKAPFGLPFADAKGLDVRDFYYNIIEGKLEAKKGLQLSTDSSQPTCDVDHRGMMWNIEGAAGVADIFQICQKTILDTYTWITK